MRQRNSQLRQENIEMRGRLRNIEMSACRKENNCSVQTKDIRPKHAKKRLLSPSGTHTHNWYSNNFLSTLTINTQDTYRHSL